MRPIGDIRAAGRRNHSYDRKGSKRSPVKSTWGYSSTGYLSKGRTHQQLLENGAKQRVFAFKEALVVPFRGWCPSQGARPPA